MADGAEKLQASSEKARMIGRRKKKRKNFPACGGLLPPAAPAAGLCPLIQHPFLVAHPRHLNNGSADLVRTAPAGRLGRALKRWRAGAGQG